MTQATKNTLFWIAILSVVVLVQWLFRGLFFVYLDSIESIPLSSEFWHSIGIGLRFDIRLAALLTLPLMFLLLFRTWIVGKGWEKPYKALVFTYLVTLFLLLIGVFIADFYHYVYLQERLNASVMRFATNAGDSFQMMWESYPVIKLFIGSILTAAVLTVLSNWFYKKVYQRISTPNTISKASKRWSIARNVVLVMVVSYFSLMGKVTSIVPVRWSEAFFSRDPSLVAIALNPVLFLYDSSNFQQDNFNLDRTTAYLPDIQRFVGVPEQTAEANAPMTSKVLSRMVQAPPANKPNIIFIHMESLGANRMGVFGNHLDATPFLDDLSRKGVLFSRFYVPSVGTAKSIFALMTGIPDISLVKTATRNPYAVDQYIPINAAKDYEKYYFIGGSANWAQVRGLLTHNIQDLKLYEEGMWESPEIDVWGISDYSLFKESNQILTQSKKPFVAFIQTAGNHKPYTIPDEDNGFEALPLTEKDIEGSGFSEVAQFQATRLLDHNLKMFFEMAEQAGYLKNTIFVLYGDHNGPAKPTKILADDEAAHISAHHVPLIIYYGGEERLIPQPQIIDAPASLVDAVPTALAAAGISHELRTLGRNLFQPNQSDSKAFLFSSRDRVHAKLGIVTSDYIARFMDNGELVESVTFAPNEKQELNEAQLHDAKDWALGMYEVSRFLTVNNFQSSATNANVATLTDDTNNHSN